MTLNIILKNSYRVGLNQRIAPRSTHNNYLQANLKRINADNIPLFFYYRVLVDEHHLFYPISSHDGEPVAPDLCHHSRFLSFRPPMKKSASKTDRKKSDIEKDNNTDKK